MAMVFGDTGLMRLSRKISEWAPNHDIMIERHETAWGEKYKMARYAHQETGSTLAYVEFVEQEVADAAWADAVSEVLIDRIERKLSVPIPGVSLAKAAVSQLHTAIIRDIRRSPSPEDYGLSAG